jgi:hypothetical protein
MKRAVSTRIKDIKGLAYFTLAFLFILSTQAPAQSYPFKKKKSIYHKGWIDLNKNGRKDLYESPDISTKKRIDDLLGRMTLKERSYYFLAKILRQMWGFRGYVITDSGALRYIYSKHHVQPDIKGAIKQAVEAGVDVRKGYFKPSKYFHTLLEMVKNGKIPLSVINSRVRDVLRVKFWLGLFNDPYVDVSKSDQQVRTAGSQTLRITLKPGQTKAVVFTLDPGDLQILNKHGHWQVIPSTFEVMIGNSSMDIRQKGMFKIVGKGNNKAYSL